jgi:hypothetical protein
MGMPARRIIGTQQHKRSPRRIGHSISQRHKRDVLPMGKGEGFKGQEMVPIRAGNLRNTSVLTNAVLPRGQRSTKA